MSCDNDGFCGTGRWTDGHTGPNPSIPLPGEPDNLITLTANAVLVGINVTWTYPATNPFAVAHTILYRGLTPDFNLALQRQIVSGSSHLDLIPDADPTTYYYWIRNVSVQGTLMGLIGPASATTRSFGEQTMEGLTARIDAGVLAMALRAEIAKIQPIDDRIFTEIQNRLAANEALADALAGIQLNLDETVAYVTSETTARTEGDSALVEQVNTLFASAAGNAALIQNEATLRVAADGVLAQQISTMAVNVTSEIDAAIVEEATIRANQDGVLVSQINAMGANVYSQAQAAIVAESTLRVTAEQALASNITTLFSRVGQADAAVITEQNARTSADGAIATQITDLYAKHGQQTTEIQAAVQVETTARANADGALAADITTLFTKSNDATAAINTEATARINGYNALTQQINTQYVTVGGDIAAAVQTESTARVNGDAALANAITTAQSEMGSNLAQTQTLLQTNINTVDGKVVSIGALYTAKVNVNGLIGGFGVYNNGTEVQAGFDVDMFWVGRTSSDKVKPFIIDSGIVYIDKARIRAADIDTLKLAGNAVTVPGYMSGAPNHNVVRTVPYTAGSVGMALPFETSIVAMLSFKSWGDDTYYPEGTAPTQGGHPKVTLRTTTGTVIALDTFQEAGYQGITGQGSYNAIGRAVLAAGTYTFEIVFENIGNPGATYWKLGQWNVVLLGTMR